jgi:hypothetical protein
MAYGTVNADVIGTSVAGSNLGAGDASLMKNRIINGAMVVSQRGTSFSSNGYTLDRWYSSSGTTGAWTVTQSSTAPTGYINSLLFTKTSGNTPASGDYNYLVQFVEGLNCTDLSWGTANAKTVTLSFWVYSGATGTFGGSLRNGAGDYSYPFTYTVSSANTWTQATVTIAGPTTGTWLTTNGVGISAFFDLGSGTSARATAGSWTAGNYIGASGTSTYPTSTSSGVLYITGVQLEVGSSATGYEYVNYQTSLANCQRYYNKFVNTSASFNRVGSGLVVSSTIGGLVLSSVTMRTTPTAGFLNAQVSDGSANPSITSASAVNAYGSQIGVEFTASGGGLTTGRACNIRLGSAGDYVDFSAEL